MCTRTCMYRHAQWFLRLWLHCECIKRCGIISLCRLARNNHGIFICNILCEIKMTAFCQIQRPVRWRRREKFRTHILTNVSCTGRETDFTQCRFGYKAAKWGLGAYHYCTLVSVLCLVPVTRSGEKRLSCFVLMLYRPKLCHMVGSVFCFNGNNLTKLDHFV